MNRSDNFNRADSASSLGTPSDSGSAWVMRGLTAGISSNQAYLVADAAPHVAYLESSLSDVSVQLTAATIGGGAYLQFRYSDDNNFLSVFWINGFQFLYKKVAGTDTQLAAISGSPTSGDVVRVDATGSTIKVYINAVLKATVTESFNSTATKHGIGFGNSTTRIDDFSITGVSSFTIDRANVLNGSGTVTLTLSGSGTTWTGSPFSLTANPSGWSISSQNVTSTTAATVTLNRSTNTGTVTITDGSTSTSVTATDTATSVASTAWATTTTWDTIETPIDGNKAVIANDVTVGASASFGTSPSDTTAVLTINSGKSLTISSGFTLTVKGNILNNGTLTVGDTSTGGATLKASAAGASPTSTTYRIRQNDTNSTIKVYGTSGSHAALLSDASGGNAYIDANTNCGLLIDMRYANVTRIGDATNPAITFANSTNPGGSTEWLHLLSCTFDSCGRLFTSNSFPSNAYWTVTGTAGSPTKFQNGAHATEDFHMSGGSTTSKIEYTSVSKILFTDPAACTVGPYLMLGAGLDHSNATTWADINKLVFWVDDVGSGAHSLRGNVSNSYFYAGGTDNPHFPLLRPGLGVAKTIDTWVVEYGGTFATDGGNLFYFVSAGDWTVTNGIVAPSATTADTAPGAFTSGGAIGLTITHCTVYSPDYNGGVLIGDGGSATGMYPTVKDNIFWVKQSDSAGTASHSIGTTADNSITPGNCTNNGCVNLASTRYQGSYPTTQPGANDIVLTSTSESTIFVDQTRNLATWAVSRGSGSSTYSTKVADAKTYLLADPSLIDDLMSHVRTGFEVKYVPFQTGSSTGNVMGAVQTIPSQYVPLERRIRGETRGELIGSA